MINQSWIIGPFSQTGLHIMIKDLTFCPHEIAAHHSSCVELSPLPACTVKKYV